jgi:glycosyltransferase involved in cell wall biosynthesis
MLAQIDVLVVPSIWYETFAFVISEAFAAGVPVVASRLGPMADRVRHEVDGLLVKPNDVPALRHALQRLCHNPELLDKLRSGIEPVKTFDDFALEIEALYQSVLNQTA